MPSQPVTLLVTGDLHLGRHPTRIPEEEDGPRFSPKTTWNRIVDRAIEEAVDAVVVTGDVVDLENRYFEAYGAYENGVQKLHDEEIPLLVVAGNHDYEALPEMHDALNLDNLHLLGRNQHWERTTLQFPGDRTIHFDGWSFGEEIVRTSPVEDYETSSPSSGPVAGILHCDLGQLDSNYAPVPKSNLLDAGPDLWLLGHIHAPAIRNKTNPLILYPGSPQALDPGEPGQHGPWTVQVFEDGSVEVDQIPMSSVRYDRLTIDVSDLSTTRELPARINQSLESEFANQLNRTTCELFLPRIRFSGRSPLYRPLKEDRSRIRNDLQTSINGVKTRAEQIVDDTRPERNLEELADGEGPVGYLARLLLDLRNESDLDRYATLIEDCQMRMNRALGDSAYRPLRRENAADEARRADARNRLREQAERYLDKLLTQKEGSHDH